MTLDDIKALEKEMITPAVAAEILGCDPQGIRIAARTEPQSLGFPVNVIGTRTRIPRRAFIQFMESGGLWFSKGREEGIQCTP